MESHRVAGYRLMLIAPDIRPGYRQFNLLIARGNAHFMRQAPDGLRGDARDRGGPFRGILLHPVHE